MAIRARYKGTHADNGEPTQYLDGIPARNLSDEEYDALPTEDKARVRGSDLYDVAPPPGSPKLAAQDPSPAEPPKSPVEQQPAAEGQV